MATNGIKEIKVSNTNYLIEPILYTTIKQTSAATAFTADLTNFELFTGVTVAVKFGVTNNGSATLNINGTGAKAIYYEGAAITASKLKAKHTYVFTYNGTQWELVGDLDTNTHRPINVNGTQVLGNNTTALNLKNGTNVTVSGTTDSSDVTISAVDTTYTFESDTNGFKVTPLGGTTQTVTVTPSITNNITGSGTANYLTKFTGENTIGVTGISIDTDNNLTIPGTLEMSRQIKLGSSTQSSAPNNSGIYIHDTRSVSHLPTTWGNKTVQWYFDSGAADTGRTGHATIMHLKGWTDSGNTKYAAHQLSFNATSNTNDGNLYHRTGIGDSWESWRTILDSNNYNNYALPLSGGTMTNSINRYYNTTDGTPMITIRSNNKDVIVFNIGHASSSSDTIGSNYTLQYTGSESNPNNKLVLTGYNSNGTAATAISINQNGVVSLPSTTSLALDITGNAAALTNKTLTATSINSTAGSYAFSIAATTDITQISTSSTDYVGLQIGNSVDKWQLTATGNHLYFRQNDNGDTNTSWNDWVKILDSSTTAAGADNAATLEWNKTYTIAKINNTDIKFTTMAKPTYAFADLTTHPTTIGDYGITDAKITSGTITLGSDTISPITAIAWDANSKKLTRTVNGETADVVTADTLRTALGLSNALHFIGVTSTSLSDGSTTSTLTAKSTGSLTKTTNFVDGDIVMDGDQLREYVWSGSAWRLLGITTSTAYSETTSENTFISSISQGTDGKITAGSRALDTTGEWTGTAAKTSTTTDTSNTLYVVGVTSSATTTLKRDTSVTVKGGAISATTYNALTLTAATTGFTIAGGSTTSKTLTVNESITLKAGSSTYLAYYNGNNVLQSHSLAHFADEFGSSVKDKKNELVLGNSTNKDSNGSAWGQLALYSSGTKGTYLRTEENSADWYTATLPAKTGVIAYTSDVTAARVEIIRLA